MVKYQFWKKFKKLSLVGKLFFVFFLVLILILDPFGLFFQNYFKNSKDYFIKGMKVIGKEEERKTSLMITEIMFDPEGFSEKGREWVELVAKENFSLKLKADRENKFELPWHLCYRLNEEGEECEKEKSIYFEKETLELKEGEYFVIVSNKKKFEEAYLGSEKKGKILESDFVLYNSSKNFLGIFEFEEEDESQQRKKVNWIDQLKYEKSWGKEGYTLERINLEKNQKANWVISREKGGSPFQGYQKEFLVKEIFFNEILPNPSGLDKNQEWIELVNQGEKNQNLEGWWIENSRGKKFFLPNLDIEKGEFLKVDLNSSRSFYLKNNWEVLTLFNSQGEEMDQVSWQEPIRENVSFNRDKKGFWQKSHFLSPGKDNILNQPPVIKIKKDQKAYQGIKFNLDASLSTDANHDKLKFQWDFGDGKKSYLAKTSHIFERRGKYQINLRVSDPSIESKETFFIEVKQYPRRKIKIVAIEPNPVGNDKGKERIVLKNYSSQKINLKGFVFSTGKNKQSLINHPIYDDFWIEAGQRRTIKNKKSCFFVLPNIKGIVQLRYPDKKVVDKISYRKEKIEEGEIYQRKEKKWLTFSQDYQNMIEFAKISQSRKDKSQSFNSDKEIIIAGEEKAEEKTELNLREQKETLRKVFYREEKKICLDWKNLMGLIWFKKSYFNFGF